MEQVCIGLVCKLIIEKGLPEVRQYGNGSWLNDANCPPLLIYKDWIDKYEYIQIHLGKVGLLGWVCEPGRVDAPL